MARRARAALRADMHHGSCLCGAVRFAVEGELPPPTACHCTQCRKHSGHYEASTDVKRAALTAPMHVGSTVAGMSPSPGVQFGGSILGYTADAVDATVGLVTGDTEKTKCAAIDAGTSLALDATGAKNTDGRVSPFYVNGQGTISGTGQEVLVNNVIGTGTGEAVGASTRCGTTADEVKTTWDSLTGISALWQRPYAKP